MPPGATHDLYLCKHLANLSISKRFETADYARNFRTAVSESGRVYSGGDCGFSLRLSRLAR